MTPTWNEIIGADPRIETLALSLSAGGGSRRTRHPAKRLPQALVKLRTLVGPERRDGRSDAVLYSTAALQVAENRLRAIAKGGVR